MPIKITRVKKDSPQVPGGGFPEGPKVRNSDPETAAAAAAKLEVQNIQQIIIDCLSKNPEGLTNRQICQITGLEWNTSSPRMRPLANKGVVVEAGKRKYGDWPVAIVWTLAVKPEGA